MCVRVRSRREQRKRSLEECACVRASSRAMTFNILQKEKKVVFTAAIHRSISRPFSEISKRIFDRLRVDLQIFHTNAIHTTRARLSTSNAHLSLFSYASARARERDSLLLLLLLLLRRKGERAREREREIFFRSVEFLFFFFPQEDEEEEEEEDF